MKAMAVAIGAVLGLGAAPPPTPAPDLTLRRAELTQGGVGYFEYEATVEGVATLGLDLSRADVSDALRSLVVRDAAGSVGGVTLPGPSGSEAAFADLPIPRAALGHPLDLLLALRGVTVSVAGATPLTGRILDAAPVPDAPGTPPGTPSGTLPRESRTRVTLLGEAGLQQFVLEDAAAVQVVDPVLRARLAAALEAERGAAASDRRHLNIHLDGSGARTVRVGMVLASPLWKAAYRLELPRLGEDHARLQGWAVLENAGLSDWTDVALTLQAGNPVAFHQDLYAIHPIARPEIPVDLLDRPDSVVDEGGVAAGALLAALPPAPGAIGPPRSIQARTAPLLAAAAPLAPPTEAASMGGTEIATAFTLPHPFSLAAGQTAAVPFLDQALPARELRLLGVFARHPLAAVELVNEGGAGLPPGAVTTLGATGFAGDARLAPFPAGARRLLTFAEDAGITADWDTVDATTLLGLAAARGVLRVTRRERHSTTITLAPSDSATQHVIVEVPRAPDTTLSTEPPGLAVERTATTWRLDLTLPAGPPLRLVAHADRMLEQSTVVADDPGIVAALLGEAGLSEAARAALRHVAELRAAADARDADLQRLQARRAALVEDEQRIRANLAAVGTTDTLRGRLLGQLERAEDGLGTLDGQLATAGTAANAAHDALSDAVGGLSL